MSENWSINELMSAGWTEHDLAWEAHCEQLAAALADGDDATAAQASASALRLAREHFSAGDPRLATSIANQAMCVAGPKAEAGKQLLDEAVTAWKGTHAWIEKMQAPRVARSSLFHMRMEQKHRGAYEDNWRIKWRDIAETTRARLARLDLSSPRQAKAAREALIRWKRERPAMLNDTRKLLAASYLLMPGLQAD